MRPAAANTAEDVWEPGEFGNIVVEKTRGPVIDPDMLPDRLDFLTRDVEFSGRGLEIAPYFNPLLSKTNYDVLYTDYVSNEVLVERTKANPGSDGRMPAPSDFIWHPGHRLSSCVPDGQRFDYAVALHVFEHVPNPLGWLNEVLEVLKVGGTLLIAVPDRHLTASDVRRRLTTFSDLIGWWVTQPSVPTPGQVCDFLSEGTIPSADAPFDFSPEGIARLERQRSDEEAVVSAVFVHDESFYLDAHCTVWVAEHFGEVMRRVIDLGILNVELTRLDRRGCEFVAVLKKLGEPSRVAPAARGDAGMLQAEVAHLEQAYAESIAVQKRLLDEIADLKVRRTWSDRIASRFRRRSTAR